MGLLKCPDCGKEFSDRIDACPNCSCPKSAILEELAAKKENTAKDQPKVAPTEYSLSEEGETPKRRNYGFEIRSEDIRLQPPLEKTNEPTQTERTYNLALSTMNTANTEFAYRGAANLFLSIQGYKDSDTLATVCLEKSEAKRLERERNKAYRESGQKTENEKPKTVYNNDPVLYPTSELKIIQDFDEYYDLNASKSLRGSKKALGILLIISAFVQILYIATGNPLAIIDLVFCGVFGVVVLNSNKKIYPLIVTIYHVVAILINIAINGKASGWVFLIIAITVTRGLSKLYKGYQNQLKLSQKSETLYCRVCGSILPKDGVYCKECGTKITVSTSRIVK